MKCTEFLQELTDYLDGKISENLKIELDEHLHWCHECHVVMNTTKKTIEIYRDNEVTCCQKASETASTMPL